MVPALEGETKRRVCGLVCFSEGGFDMSLILTNFKHICTSICCVKCFCLTMLDYRLPLTTQLTPSSTFLQSNFEQESYFTLLPCILYLKYPIIFLSNNYRYLYPGTDENRDGTNTVLSCHQETHVTSCLMGQ